MENPRREESFFFFKYFILKIYLFIWLSVGLVVAARRLSCPQASGILVSHIPCNGKVDS